MKNFGEVIDANVYNFEEKVLTSLEKNGVVVITNLIASSIV